MAVGSKAKILETARELFYRNGYLATSVDDIIEAARVSKSNFYYHFKSKEDLGIAVLELRREEFRGGLDRTLRDMRATPMARLEEFLDLLARGRERQSAAGCPFGNMVAEMAERSE